MGSNHKTAFVDDQLDFLEKSELYRRLKTVVAWGPTAKVDGKNVINLCSNDYLGLSKNKKVIEKTITALHEVSQCSSRLLAGNHPKSSSLKICLHAIAGTESALYILQVTPNLGVIMTIADKRKTIFSDELEPC